MSGPEITVQVVDLAEYVRADEALIVDGYGARESACLINEQQHPAYIIETRCSIAAAVRARDALATWLGAPPS